jgi:shikimate dehydrogenase
MEYGLVGEKLSHSLSERIHKEFGLYDYSLCEVNKQELDSLLKARSFRGLNVTIPYKQTVIPYCDKLSKVAKQIGSVNTLVVDNGRKLIGYNTDYLGFIYMVRRTEFSFINKKVLVLGSGGTSLTARAAAKNIGAREIIVVSRKSKVNYSNVYNNSDVDVIINTTPVGMFPNNGGRLLDLTKFNKLSGVIDVIYNPMRTDLILQAMKLKIPCTGGLPMLAAQAQASAELFSGEKLDNNIIEKILQKLTREFTNIVLIGMPGNGKTNIGKSIAEKLHRECVDIDEEVEKMAGMSIPEIFRTHGEAYFRNIECKAAAQAGKRQGIIIACGGGTVLRTENILPLKQNGRIYYIKRNLNDLCMENRPLSTDITALKEMEQTRMPVYEKISDCEITNNATIADATERLVSDFHKNIY